MSELTKTVDSENTTAKTSRTGMSEERWEYLKKLKPSKGRMIHVSKYPKEPRGSGLTFVKKKKAAETPKAM